MKALVLAAGLGERVRPLTEKTPKPMLEVGGRPLIHYPLAMLKRAGIIQVAINVHHLAGEIQRGLHDGKSLGIEITYSPESTLAGTGGPLNALRGYFGDETFVLANSDSILDLDLAAMIAFHRDRGAIATIGLFKPNDGREYEHIEVNHDARICRMRLIKSRNPLTYEDYPTELGDTDPSSLELVHVPGHHCHGARDIRIDTEVGAVGAVHRPARADGGESAAGLRLCAHRIFPHRG